MNGAGLPQILGVIMTLLGLVVAYFLGSASATGNYMLIMLVLGGMGALLVFMQMGKKYWLLVPFGFSIMISALPVGGRSFELWELCCIGAFGLFVARVALKQDHLYLARPENSGVFLYVAWAMFILWLNPVGMFFMGATTGGARFYMQIILCFLGFLVVSNQSPTAKDAKWILWLFIGGTILTAFMRITSYFLFGSGGGDIDSAGDDFYSWHQMLSTIPVAVGAWMFTRYPISKVFSFSQPHLAVIYGACLLMGLFSGKRAALAIFLLYPFLALFLRRSDFRACLGYAAVFFIGLIIAGGGNGNLFTLPMGVQRSLSVFPGNWDPSFKKAEGAHMDDFRSEMRRLAVEKIKLDPWIGKGFGISAEDTGWINPTLVYHMIPLLAMGSAWHSTWYGIAADFGIIGTFWWAIYVLYSLYTGRWVYVNAPRGSPQQILAGTFTLFMLHLLARSYTSGTSYGVCVDQWWMFGILLAMKYTLQQEMLATKVAKAAQPVGEPDPEKQAPALPIGRRTPW